MFNDFIDKIWLLNSIDILVALFGCFTFWVSILATILKIVNWSFSK
jgi:hypothetical protein